MGINTVAFAELCLLLNQEKPRSIPELIELTGVTKNTACRWINLLKTKKLIYIVQWKNTETINVALWRWGYREDSAPRPKPLTDSQRGKRYRQRVRQKQEDKEFSSKQSGRGSHDDNERSARNIQQSVQRGSSDSGFLSQEAVRILTSFPSQKVSDSHPDSERS